MPVDSRALFIKYSETRDVGLRNELVLMYMNNEIDSETQIQVVGNISLTQ